MKLNLLNIKNLIFISAVFLSACASTGVIPTSQDSFMIGKKDGTPGLGISLSNQADVYKEANSFCIEKGMQVETLNLIVIPAAPAKLGSTELHFKCVPQKQNTAIAVSNESNSKSSKLDFANIGNKSERDAVAIIIGIQNYKRLGKADFANQDAERFAEYAHRALGIPKSRIKTLTDADADQAALLKTFRNWLPLQVNKDKTDVFVFYSGHGLPSADGKSLYLLPHGVDHDLLDETAVDQRKIVAAIQAAKPRSVTMFIDSCYSGLSKAGDTLLAGAKPVTLKNTDMGYPPEFTVMSASLPDQISSASAELQHGIFSFYLMKGMEGGADLDKDGKITVGEMHKFLMDNVPRQAMSLNRKQEPQLFGDANRVLVGR
jgi:hypothetical protein